MKNIIFTENAPRPIGPYSQAILNENMLFISGQLGINLKTNEIEKDIKRQTQLVLLHIKNILEKANMTIDDVVKTTIFVTDLKDFSSINEVYEQFFKVNPPSRSCVQIVALPLNANVEIEAIAIKSENNIMI